MEKGENKGQQKERDKRWRKRKTAKVAGALGALRKIMKKAQLAGGVF